MFLPCCTESSASRHSSSKRLEETCAVFRRLVIVTTYQDAAAACVGRSALGFGKNNSSTVDDPKITDSTPSQQEGIEESEDTITLPANLFLF